MALRPACGAWGANHRLGKWGSAVWRARKKGSARWSRRGVDVDAGAIVLVQWRARAALGAFQRRGGAAKRRCNRATTWLSARRLLCCRPALFLGLPPSRPPPPLPLKTRAPISIGALNAVRHRAATRERRDTPTTRALERRRTPTERASATPPLVVRASFCAAPARAARAAAAQKPCIASTPARVWGRTSGGGGRAPGGGRALLGTHTGLHWRAQPTLPAPNLTPAFGPPHAPRRPFIDVQTSQFTRPSDVAPQPTGAVGLVTPRALHRASLQHSHHGQA